MVKNYKVITLCGSTRFKDEFLKVQKEYAKAHVKKVNYLESK